MEEYKTYNIISNEINAKNEKENTFQNRHSKQFQNKKEKMVNGEIKDILIIDSPNMPQYAPEMSEQPKGQGKSRVHWSYGHWDKFNLGFSALSQYVPDREIYVFIYKINIDNSILSKHEEQD